jgi:hypothetical protein
MGCIIAASKDSRIKTVVSLAAPHLGKTHFDNEYTEEFRSEIDWESVLSASRNIRIPIQFQVGTHDSFAANNTKTYFDVVNSSSKEFIPIEGGNHVQFIDDDFILSRSASYGLFIIASI